MGQPIRDTHTVKLRGEFDARVAPIAAELQALGMPRDDAQALAARVVSRAAGKSKEALPYVIYDVLRDYQSVIFDNAIDRVVGALCPSYRSVLDAPTAQA